MEVYDSKISEEPSISSQVRDRGAIQAWIIDYLAQLLEIDPEQVDITVPFDRYGLESADAYAMTGDLESWLDKEIDATAIYDYPTIEALSEHLGSIPSQ